MVIMDKIFFSIIIPTYNQGEFLEKCISSCLSQTYQNFEIIVIDNNSTDATNKILKKYEKKIIYKKFNNEGVISKSRNIALKIAKGNWIALLDSDDYFSLEKLEETKNAILNNSFDVFLNSEWMLDRNSKLKEIWFYGNKKKNFYLDLIKYGSCLSTSASVVKREFLEHKSINFNESKEIKNVADYDFFLNIAREGGKFYFLKKPLGFHLIHEKSTGSQSVDTFFIALKKLLNNHFELDYIKRNSYFFSLLNLKVIEVISNRSHGFMKKIFNLFKILIQNPIDFSFIIFRIIIKKIKIIFFNYIYKQEKINLQK